MVKNLLRSIKRSFGRYIAIVAIIALGAGLFVGLLATKTDMIYTGQRYMDRQNMFDLRLANAYGWSDAELSQISKMDGVAQAEGIRMLDVLGTMGKRDGEQVYQLYGVPERINKVYLLGGRMPQAPNECLADGAHLDDSVLGTTFTVSNNNSQDALDSLHVTEFTVVGYVNSPLFMDMTRGNTTLGNGSVTAFVYIPQEAFNMDYYAMIDITIHGQYAVYTDEYDQAVSDVADRLENQVLLLAQNRYEQLKADGEQQYADGLAEYNDGLLQYEEGRQEALAELEKAEKELNDAEKQLLDNEKLLADGEALLIQGEKDLREGQKLLIQSRKQFLQTKADTYKQLNDSEAELINQKAEVEKNLSAVESGLDQINDGLQQIESGAALINIGISTAQSTLRAFDTTLGLLETAIPIAEAALQQAKLDQSLPAEAITRLEEELNNLKQRQADLIAQKAQTEQKVADYQAQLAELETTKQELLAQEEQLEIAKAQLAEGLSLIQDGLLQIETGRLQADTEFAAAQLRLDESQMQLDDGMLELEISRMELEEGKKALEDGKRQLEEGKAEFEKGREEAFDKLEEGRLELEDARVKLEDARLTLDEMTSPELYLLDRNTNAGYIAVNSNSDIVAGVSRVFPVFFLLVAALVCITTMTRMVEEERTQIGTLKALGYSNMAIIGKYLMYAGTAAILGCGFGVFVGSIVFPNILWAGYSIIISLTPQLEILFDIPLCVTVVAVYTATMLLVTWSCCRLSLRQVPAELIRPKAPTSGKKIFLEYLPFWEKFSFLNKVMWRNIFRYRQRLAMMLVGIGGCTALLVTGFGLGDSVMDIVQYQFEEITVYDMSAQFDSGVDDVRRQAFLNTVSEYAEDVGFAHQSGVDLLFGDGTRNVYMVIPEGDMSAFFDFHSGKQKLSLPRAGEALVSVGAAEDMGISVGDVITVRNSDMQTLQVRVSGVFDNNVYNYVILSPQTVLEAWKKPVEYQVAYLNVYEEYDPQQVSATVSGCDGVLSVMVSSQIANQVGSMLDALNLIVATVVICAALLAVIVLYNLTNINIKERLREIATIKVLGFNAWESAMYVFKENLILSVMGSGLGLIGGWFLLVFVMDQIKIDMVWFQARLLPMSLVWSVVITVLMAILVDVLLYFRLEKINMAEALKPVE